MALDKSTCSCYNHGNCCTCSFAEGNKRKQQQEGNGSEFYLQQSTVTLFCQFLEKRPKTHTVKNGKSEKGKSKKKKEPGSIITITDHNDKVADKGMYE